MAYPILAQGTGWYRGTTSKSIITQINIVDNYTITGNENENWNADTDNSGSIKCYVTDTVLTIVGNGSGKIAMHSNSANLFNGFGVLVRINGGNMLDTSNTSTMERMFQACFKLEYVDVSTWDTSKVTSMKAMFQGATSIGNLDTSEWVTSNVTDMSYMFSMPGAYLNTNLVKLDVSNWDVSKVTTMSLMFANMQGLTTLDVSNWDTSSCTTMESMFQCSSSGGHGKLTAIDVSNWDVSNVENMQNMFYGQKCITKLDLTNWNTKKVNNMIRMFFNCSSLQNIDVSNKWDVSNVMYGQVMFDGCVALVGGSGTAYNSSNTDLSYAVIDNGDASLGYLTYMGKKVLADTHTMWLVADAVRAMTGENISYSIKEIISILRGYTIMAPQAEWYKSNTVAMEDITDIAITASYTPTGSENESWNADIGNNGSIKCYRTGTSVTIAPTGKNKIRLNADSSNLFANMKSLTSISGLSVLEMSHVENLSSAFENDVCLQSVDASAWDLQTVKHTNLMFANCHDITSINLGCNLNAIGTKMFSKCLKLSTIAGLSNITTIGDRAFIYVPEITSIDIASSKITSIGESACRLSNIEDLVDLSVVPVENIGEHATRHKRWDAESLANIKTISAPQLIYMDVPNAETQNKYTYKYDTFDGEDISVANGACASFALYHMWQVMHPDTAYANWEEWWNDKIEAAYKQQDGYVEGDSYLEGGNPLSWDGIKFMIKALGWNFIGRRIVSQPEHKEMLINELINERPVQISMRSANVLDKSHAIVAIGYNPETDKIAICDSKVCEDKVVFAWIAFEDIFSKDEVDCGTNHFMVMTY